MKTNLFLIVFSCMLVSCSGRGSSTSVGAEAAKTEVTTEVSGTRDWVINTELSEIRWKGFKPGGSHNGTLKIKEGVLLLKANAIVGGNFVINMNSIVNEDLSDAETKDKLVGHLKSADFFDVEKYPTGEFIITSVTPKEGNKQEITGNLTLKGISKSITFLSEISTADGRFTILTPAFTIDRTQWEVNYQSKNIFKNLKDQFINDEIEISVWIVTK